ncbi:MAG: Mpo1-like protein [Planctomycetota bacterium]
MHRWWADWRSRHRNPASLALHVVAIPALPAAAILAGIQLWEGEWGLWWRPAGLFLSSYLLQWVGHRIEGNDMGEVILFKKAMGRPYVALAPERRRTGLDRLPSQASAPIRSPRRSERGS